MPNESAISFAWLSQTLALGQPQASLAERLWAQTAQQMSGHTQSVVYLQDWLSDFWLARGTRVDGMTLAPAWDPPSAFAEFRAGGSAMGAGAKLTSRPTNHAAFTDMLARNPPPELPFDPSALPEFLQRESEIAQNKDARMVQGEHVRAWLATSLGHLLMGIVLSPQDPSLMLAAATRLRLPLQFQLPASYTNDFEERRLEFLYNWRIAPDNSILQTTIRSGQGESWREHWTWLSAELTTPDTLASVQLAARLMRSPVLSGILLASLGSPNDYLRTASLAILRRWLLTLKVMAWLEEALAYSWRWVRPQDLACFAFAALKPDWPPRLMAISHRSADVKPALMKMQLWQSSRAAIDARFIPAWETNTGMMWGLFAAPPLLVRVDSPTYTHSIWCAREIELIEYLARQGDFLADRAVVDLPVADLAQLDRILPVWSQGAGDELAEAELKLPFPPPCAAWSPGFMDDWEVKLYRASAALRMMNVFFDNVALTNQLADKIYLGMEFPGDAPTNNPDGWQSYAAILRDLKTLLPGAAAELPLHLPATYTAEDRALDDALAQRIPSLSTGEYQLGDILVAFEWLRTEWPILREEESSDFIVLDCKQFNREIWTGAIELSLHRGLAAIRTPGPLWFLQLAGQDVENWPFVGERPIFTQHVPDQFNWMLQIWLDRRASQSRYPTDSGMALSPELAALCATPPEAP